eukprot:scaffold447_cov112-Skeletonema_dohrnii-CCMP3373.AAC.6
MVILRQASITAALIICSSAALGQQTDEKVCASPASSAECSTTVETSASARVVHQPRSSTPHSRPKTRYIRLLWSRRPTN